MKPEKIILVRHGQSQGNVDLNIYEEIPDFAVKLTPLGHEQAKNVGLELAKIPGNFHFYVSSYHRTRQTFKEIITAFDKKRYTWIEESRLREQEWSHGPATVNAVKSFSLEKERAAIGSFYYRFPGGESCADVELRIASFLNTLFRDFEKDDFPKNCVIVSHGMTNRVFLKKFLKLTVEEFEKIKNPKNCSRIVLELQENGKYKLVTELEKYPKATHPYEFPL
jgi:broad specificity phosphatase PhoE